MAEERASLEILHEKDVILSQCYQTIDQLQLVIQEKDAQIQELKQYPLKFNNVIGKAEIYL